MLRFIGVRSLLNRAEKIVKLNVGCISGSNSENVYFGCFGNPMEHACNCDDGSGYNYKTLYLNHVKDYEQDNNKYTRTPYKHGKTRDYISTKSGVLRIEPELYTFKPKPRNPNNI